MAICLSYTRCLGYERCGAGQTIPDEYVLEVIRIPSNEVGPGTGKHYVASVERQSADNLPAERYIGTGITNLIALYSVAADGLDLVDHGRTRNGCDRESGSVARCTCVANRGDRDRPA